MITIIAQELRLIFSKLSNILNQVIFFLIALSIFAISFSYNSQQIHQPINIAIIWICLIFSILLGSNNSFKEDFEDGTMEQLFMSGYIAELIIAGKIIANWLAYCLPLIATIPLAALILKLDYKIILNLVLITIIVTLIINFIANFCASLIISTNGGGGLLTILVLPLTIPIIIFANSSFNNFQIDIFYSSLKFLLSILIFLAPILIFATTAAMKFNLDD